METRSARICVVGSGTRFLSGITYYTHQLATSLAGSHAVSAILMRQLLPTRLYPGAGRVGSQLTKLAYGPEVPTFDGVDWYWLPSMLRALCFLRRQHPDVLLLEWWTGTVLHSYLLLAIAARLLRARVVIEFHEVLDVGELRMPLARAYVRLLAPLLFRLAQGYVVHSAFDAAAIAAAYQLDLGGPVAVIPHGPFAQYRPADGSQAERSRPPRPRGAPALTHSSASPASPASPASSLTPCRLLYFGVIRQYKGVEDLIAAFDLLSSQEAARYHLTIVGEPWEGWTRPAEMIAASPHRHRIRFVNRYVADDEVSHFFAEADAVVLPYHRSSASGPLHIAMSHGLPVVVTRVGGLIEATQAYAGAILVEPRHPEELRAAFARAAALRGKRYADPHAWEASVRKLDALIDAVTPARRGLGEIPQATVREPVPVRMR